MLLRGGGCSACGKDCLGRSGRGWKKRLIRNAPLSVPLLRCDLRTAACILGINKGAEENVRDNDDCRSRSFSARSGAPDRGVSSGGIRHDCFAADSRRDDRDGVWSMAAWRRSWVDSYVRDLPRSFFALGRVDGLVGRAENDGEPGNPRRTAPEYREFNRSRAELTRAF
jgi:hypothetical protein